MSRFDKLMNVAKRATPDRLERCERIIYPHACRAMRSGMLIESQLERVLKTLSERTGVGIRAIKKAYRAIADANPALRSGTAHVGPYSIQDGQICRERGTSDGPVTVPLCNFTARIVEERERDDGLERIRVFRIEGELANGVKLPHIEVSAAQFAAMNWPVGEWGSRAVAHAGQGVKDHLRAAIQMFSGDVPRRTIYTHLGWREIDGVPCFLHAGGALGVGGSINGVHVDAPQGLERFILPAPPEKLAEVVRASLATLDLAPDKVTVPLLTSVYRAVVGGADFSMHLVGETGEGKSELAAIFQQHFGAGLDARNLPGSWGSTANALEGMSFSAKDVLAVIDDFAPEGTAQDIARYHATEARLLRAQGNSSARGRMRADGTLRAPRPPRGMVLSTGEDVPKGQSIRARTLILELEKGALDWERLSEAQESAAQGTYAAALAGFICWLARDYGALQTSFAADHKRFREHLQRNGHKRTTDAGAQLLAAWHTFLTFALEVGAISVMQQAELWRRVNRAIAAALTPQVTYQAHSDPVARFTELLFGLFTSRRAHLSNLHTGQWPGEGWGWEPYDVGEAYGSSEVRYRPKGYQIGWLDGTNLYLEPAATFAELQRFAKDQGEAIPVTETTLWKRLYEKGLIASREAPHMTVKRSLGSGERKRVLHLYRSRLEKSGASGASGTSTVADDIQFIPYFFGKRRADGETGARRDVARKFDVIRRIGSSRSWAHKDALVTAVALVPLMLKPPALIFQAAYFD